MFEARIGGRHDDAVDVGRPYNHHQPSAVKRPVLTILHQEHSNPGHIGQWFCRNGYTLDIRKPRFGDPLPASLDRHSGVVIFGGPQSANDGDEFIAREIGLAEIALTEQRPYLGVCLGAQMLARCLGAKVAPHPQKAVEIGYHKTEATADGHAIAEWPEHFYQWHKEGFDVPKGARLLAKGVSGAYFENQAFAYGKGAVAIQFHPEITLAQVHRWTGYNNDKLTQTGAQSRESQIADHFRHAPKVHAWLDTFLDQWIAGRLPLAEKRVQP